MACGLGFPSKTPWPPKSASSTMFEALRLVICCDVGSSLDMTLAISEWSLSHPQTLNVMSFPCFLKSLHIPFLGSNTNSCGAEKIEGRAATLELFRKERKQISKILKFPDCVLFFSALLCSLKSDPNSHSTRLEESHPSYIEVTTQSQE